MWKEESDHALKDLERLGFRASGRHYNLVSTCCAPSQIQSTQFTDVHCHGLGKVSRLRMGHHHRDEELLLSINLMQHSDESPSRNLEAINQIYIQCSMESWYHLMIPDVETKQIPIIPLATLHRPHRHQAGFTSKAGHHFFRRLLVLTPFHSRNRCLWMHPPYDLAGGQNSTNQPPSSQTHLSKETCGHIPSLKLKHISMTGTVS